MEHIIILEALLFFGTWIDYYVKVVIRKKAFSLSKNQIPLSIHICDMRIALSRKGESAYSDE